MHPGFRQHGFTLVEAALVTVLAGCAAAYGVNRYMDAQARQEADACSRNSLLVARGIMNAAAISQLEGKSPYRLPADAETLFGLTAQNMTANFGAEKLCPAGGELRLGTVTEDSVEVRCPLHGSGTAGKGGF